MKRTIFYSWQSDLPNNTNRGFIESCIKGAIKNLAQTTPFSIELNLDRDTYNVSGTPDIVDSIFTKISRSKIFIADVSIINSSSQERKCPNPNVLIELGFAVRVLGWNRVFCIYNLDYGNFDDLPFDLRQRRPITYSLNESGRRPCQQRITKILTDSINTLHRNGGLFDKVDDYVKTKVDTEVLTIAGHLAKMLFGYKDTTSLSGVSQLLALSDAEIEQQIVNVELIGFQIFKNLKIHEYKFRQLADSAISSVHHNREMAAVIIEFIDWVGRFDALNSVRNPSGWFKQSGKNVSNYRVAPPSEFQKNDELPHRYILLKTLKDNMGIVVDFGDFPYKDRVEHLLTKYRFNVENKETFLSIIRHFISTVENWLDLTNGEFILDTYQQFEIREHGRADLPFPFGSPVSGES